MNKNAVTWAILAFMGLVLAVPTLAERRVELQWQVRWLGIDLAVMYDTVHVTNDQFSLESNLEPVGLAQKLRLPSIKQSSSGHLARDGLPEVAVYVMERRNRTYTSKAGFEESVIVVARGAGSESSYFIPIRPVLSYQSVIYTPFLMGAVPDNIHGLRMSKDPPTAIYYARRRNNGKDDAIVIERLSDGNKQKMVIAPTLSFLPVSIVVGRNLASFNASLSHAKIYENNELVLDWSASR